MNSDRRRFLLGDVLEELIDHRGRTPKKLGGDWAAEGVPVISAKNIKDGRLFPEDVRYVTQSMWDAWMPTKLATGDVLLTSEAPLGEVAYLSDNAEYCLGQRLFALRPRPDRVVRRYLYYMLQSPPVQHAVLSRATGTTAQGIRQAELVKVPIELPPLEDQRRVVDVLGPLDRLVENRNRIVKMLERTSRALFQSWFVEFDPARRPGAWPDSVTAIYPDSFRESPLGPIPAGWDVRPVSEALEVNPGRRLKRGTLAPYVGLADISETSPRVPSWRHREYTSGSRFTNHDVLMARITPSLENGKVAYVDCLPADTVGWGSTEFIVLRSRSPLPSAYAYFVASDAQFRAHAVANMTGSSGRQRVPVGALDHYQIVIPDQPVADLFAGFAEPVFRLARAYQNSASVAEQLRNALLPKLISGELTVQEAEERVEEVA